MPDTPTPCALCGYEILAALGDFYTAVPGWPGLYVHTISCGAPFHNMDQVAEPALRWVDGIYQKIS